MYALTKSRPSGVAVTLVRVAASLSARADAVHTVLVLLNLLEC
jgi:hypothetical protein